MQPAPNAPTIPLRMYRNPTLNPPCHISRNQAKMHWINTFGSKWCQLLCKNIYVTNLHNSNCLLGSNRSLLQVERSITQKVVSWRETKRETKQLYYSSSKNLTLTSWVSMFYRTHPVYFENKCLNVTYRAILNYPHLYDAGKKQNIGGRIFLKIRPFCFGSDVERRGHEEIIFVSN